jgi:hypothetical protein
VRFFKIRRTSPTSGKTTFHKTEKPDLIDSAWVAPLQSDVWISGFNLDNSIQGPSGVSPEDPSYLPSSPITSALEHAYQYIENNPPEAGYEAKKPSGIIGVLFSNALFWPVTINLNVPKSVVTKCQFGAGFPSQAPAGWTMVFYDAEDFEIGEDV